MKKIDEKVALIDTIEHGFEDEFLANINEAVGDRPLDYLVVNHMEPDHSSLVRYTVHIHGRVQASIFSMRWLHQWALKFSEQVFHFLRLIQRKNVIWPR